MFFLWKQLNNKTYRYIPAKIAACLISSYQFTTNTCFPNHVYLNYSYINNLFTDFRYTNRDLEDIVYVPKIYHIYNN